MACFLQPVEVGCNNHKPLASKWKMQAQGVKRRFTGKMHQVDDLTGLAYLLQGDSRRMPRGFWIASKRFRML